MKNVVYQQLQGESKTAVLTVAIIFSLFFSLSARSGIEYCQSDYSDWPVAEKVESPDGASAAELAGTPADLAPYSYGFYSQIYLVESIYAPAPAEFSLFS